jgi:hypothetical protein
MASGRAMQSSTMVIFNLFYSCICVYKKSNLVGDHEQLHRIVNWSLTENGHQICFKVLNRPAAFREEWTTEISQKEMKSKHRMLVTVTKATASE